MPESDSLALGRHPHQHPVQLAFGWVCVVLALPLLYWLANSTQAPVLAQATWLFWHSVLGLVCVAVALLTGFTGYNAIFSVRQCATMLLGAGFLAVALLDFLHLSSILGMAMEPSNETAQRIAFFALCSRWLVALLLLFYVLCPESMRVTATRRALALWLSLLASGALAVFALCWPEQLPQLLAGMQGAAPKGVALEWWIAGLHTLTLAALWLRRRALVRECFMALVFAVALSALALLFCSDFGVRREDYACILSRLYTALAYLYLFHATSNEALTRPLQRLQVQHQREESILNAAPDAVLWVNEAGIILMNNPAAELLTGYSGEELIGQNVSLLMPAHVRANHAHVISGYFRKPHARAMGNMDLNLLRKDGGLVPVDISLGHWEDDGERYAIAYMRDLTERKKFEESLRHQATHDELTGLGNRWLFNLQLGQILARAARSNLIVAVLFIDLDDFKHVNDTFGHAAGDSLLVQTGARIRSVLREGDTLTRMGGDEFSIALTDLTDMGEAVTVATKVLQQMQQPFVLDGRTVHSGGSIGIAFYPNDAPDFETLLRYADMAMYQAKQAGRGVYACYSKDLDLRMHEDMQLHTRLQEALTHGLLSLHYQAQVETGSGRIVGAEALLRWNDPVLGQVPPGRFIPVAEATGLILPLSAWVLQTACTQIAAWHHAGLSLPVAVNFSTQQFRQLSLPAQVQAALAATEVPAHLLVIEITETAAMAKPELAREQMNALVALGCQVALDDFGTGYSSLAYLKMLPVHKLKIDGRFIEGLPHDVNDAAISHAIIALAHSMGLTLVAEGVETEAQLAFLYQHGCEVYQGWLHSKAMEAGALTILLQAQQRWSNAVVN